MVPPVIFLSNCHIHLIRPLWCPNIIIIINIFYSRCQGIARTVPICIVVHLQTKLSNLSSQMKSDILDANTGRKVTVRRQILFAQHFTMDSVICLIKKESNSLCNKYDMENQRITSKTVHD